MEQTSIAPQTNSNTNLNSNSNSDFVKKGDWEFMPANNKWYAKHINSSIQIPQTFDKIPSIEDGGATDLYLVKTDNSSFFVNSKGNILGNQSYTDAKRFNIDGYASVKTGSKWGIIGLDGNFIVTPKSDEQIIKKDDVFIIKKGNSIINEQIKNKVEKKKEVIQQKVQHNVNQAVNQSYNYNQQAGDEMKAKSIEDKNRPVLNKIKSKVANKTAKK